MTKQKRGLIRAVALCLLICLCVSVVACAEQTPADTQSTSGEKLTYTVSVKTQGGQALSGVSVYIYTDESQSELVWVDKTDDNGCMSFKDVTCEGYVAFLSGVPTGYQVEASYPITGETTEIVLASMLGEVEDLTTITYSLGDVMNDFTVTAPDGTEYTLSALLAEKEAVVLNFWYLQCGPCKSEFPYLQQAYQQYGDKVEVLALNPVNEDPAEVAAFQEENGYTFPMMLCDPSWVEAMQLTAYPTTVVIDRFGVITLIHKGSITDAETFENIFAFFSSEEYEQTIVEDVEEIPSAQPVLGTETDPIEMGVTPSFTLTVPAKSELYVTFYRVSTQYLQVNGSDAYIIYKNRTYTASGGSVGVTLTADDTISGVSVIIGNSSTEDKTFSCSMSALKGSYGNPYTLELGEFTASVAAGNDQGVYYTYTAAEAGTLSVECLEVTAGVPYNLVLYNLSTYAYRNMGEGGKYGTVSVKVRAGDKIQFIAGSLPDDGGVYPAATFKLRAFMEEGTEEEEEEEKLTYAVTVTDADRTPISGVRVFLVVDDETTTLTTNADGIAYTKLPAGEYPATVNVPRGYTARNTSFQLTEAIPTISVKLDAVEVTAYTVTVLNESGKPVENALVSVGESSGRTDKNGKITFNLEKGSYTAAVSASGYAFASVPFESGKTELTVTLQEGVADGIDYTVTVLDYFGDPMKDTTVSFWKDGGIVGMADTDASGVAVTQLEPGTYTVTVSNCYLTSAKTTLTETEPSITITAVVKCGNEYTNRQGYDLYYVDEGATYATLSTTEVNGKDIVDNFFLFVPERSGTYQFTTSNPSAEIHFYSTTAFIFETTPESYANNSFTYSIRDDAVENGVGIVVGVTGSPDCILLITRIGDAQATVEDYPWYTEWQTGETPSKAYTAGSGKLTYVDITAASSAYTLVYNESDGYYHLGSATGPVMMVRLDLDAPYLSLKDMVDNTGVKRYFYNADGSFLRKEDYTAYVIACVECMDTTYGTYPLTKDLKYILEGYGGSVGWYDSTSATYLFGTMAVNEDIAWMFACCYMS